MCMLVIWVQEFVVIFFSSRRRHTRCALVTGVQTCALPILDLAVHGSDRLQHALAEITRLVAIAQFHRLMGAGRGARGRSEERRVGKECVSTCSSRWSPDH